MGQLLHFRVEVTGSLFLVTTTFGDHTLHHLFPTIDHSKLPHLYPAFLETCTEFNIPYTFVKQSYMLKGMYKQILSSTPNTDPPGYNKHMRQLLSPSVVEELKRPVFTFNK